MGLKADVEEVALHWRRAPWRVKVFLVLALFLSTTSLASLAETVFRWKGFVLDALGFYRHHISEPVSVYLTHLLGHSLPTHFVDQAVIFGLFFGALIRCLFLRNMAIPRRALYVSWFVVLYGLMLVALALEAPDPRDSNSWFAYPLFVFAGYVITRGAERVLVMAYMLIPVLGVGVLAAVSVGLAK